MCPLNQNRRIWQQSKWAVTILASRAWWYTPCKNFVFLPASLLPPRNPGKQGMCGTTRIKLRFPVCQILPRCKTGKECMWSTTCEKWSFQLPAEMTILLVGEASPNPFEQLRAGAGCASLRDAFTLASWHRTANHTIMAYWKKKILKKWNVV